MRKQVVRAKKSETRIAADHVTNSEFHLRHASQSRSRLSSHKTWNPEFSIVRVSSILRKMQNSQAPQLQSSPTHPALMQCFDGTMVLPQEHPLVKTEPGVVEVSASMKFDLHQESMRINAMQMTQLLNGQPNLLCIEEFMGYVSELVRVVSIHCSNFISLRTYLATKEDQQSLLLSKLDHFASLVATKDSNREFLAALADLNQTILQHKVSLDVASLDQKALDDRQTKLSERMPSNEQVKLLHSLIQGLQENMQTQARALGELQVKAACPDQSGSAIPDANLQSLRGTVSSLEYKLSTHETECSNFCHNLQTQITSKPSIIDRLDVLEAGHSLLESQIRKNASSKMQPNAEQAEQISTLESSLASTRVTLVTAREELHQCKDDIEQLQHDFMMLRNICTTTQEEGRNLQSVLAGYRWSSPSNQVEGILRDQHPGQKSPFDRVVSMNSAVSRWIRRHWRVILSILLLISIGENFISFEIQSIAVVS